MKKIDRNNIEDILALTPMQEGMLFHYLKAPGEDHYFEQLCLNISGEIDTSLFEKAWNTVIETNELLRTVFRWEKTEYPIQIILKEHQTQPVYIDLTGRECSDTKKRLEEIKKKDSQEKFDLQEVPFRVTLCTVDTGKYVMIISNHHILFDGWSTGIILKEFFSAYNTLSRGNPLTKIKPVKTKYKEFIERIQNININNSDQESYWKNYLNGFETRVELSIKRSSFKKQKVEGPGNYQVNLSSHIKGKLEILAKEKKLTIASVLYTAWGILLNKYNHCDDVIFGTTVSGRAANIKGIEDMVGLFINTLPLRLWAFPAELVIIVLQRTHHSLQTREKYEHTPLVKIKKYSEIDSEEELFDTLVVIENYPLERRLIMENSKLSVDSYSMSEMTHYDLTVSIKMFREIDITFSYNKDLFDKEIIVKLSSHFISIVGDLLENPGKKIREIEILSKQEKHHVLYDFNAGNKEKPYTKNKTIHGLFAEQVRKTPDNIALKGISRKFPYSNYNSAGPGCGASLNGVQLSYKYLNEKSHRLAGILREKGITDGTISALMVERSLEMIVGILGILKAGGAYLPIDPDYPEERVTNMLTDARVKILVKKGRGNSNFRTGGKLFVLDFEQLDFEPGPGSLDFEIHHPDLNAANLAYIIYTSGSTGIPRGVPITHANFSPLLHWGYEHLGIGPGDRVIQNLSYSFDWSVWEIFITLTTGAGLYMITAETLLNPQAEVDFIQENGITVLHITPTQYRYLLDVGKKPLSLKYLFIGAEKLTADLLQRSIQSVGEDCRVFNMYGPTEAAIISAVLEINRDSYRENKYGDLTSVPVGKPVANAKLLVLDRYRNLCPVNVPGELQIAGHGLSKGYLNNPELTGEKFSLLSGHNSYGRLYHTLYHTGDLVRWLPDGNIEFLGRMDRQVKVRGFRIETGEIVNRLLTHNSVKEAEVIVREDRERGENYLCAYIVEKDAVDISMLRVYLLNTLPAHMIPAYFVKLERMPLNPNGKIDLKALPEPEITPGEGYTAPRDDIETKLAGIWTDVLNLNLSKETINAVAFPLPVLVGIDDNFFQLGGHSLKATTLVYRVYKEFEINIKIEDVFTYPTIREQARRIKDAGGLKYFKINPGEEKEYYDLSYAQRRLWVLCQFEEDSTAYNMPGARQISGPFRIDIFQQAVRALANRHDSLRTVFISIDGVPRQKVTRREDFNFNLENEDLRCLNQQEKEQKALEIYIEEANRVFPLEQGPLFRFKTVRLEENEYLLICNIHHIVNDGWSQGIVNNELMTLYNTFSSKCENPLRRLELQYKDYTRWHNGLIQGDGFKKSGQYWLEKFKDKPNGMELPLDRPRKAIQTFNGGRVTFYLSKEKNLLLRRLGLKQEATLFMGLLTLLNIFLYRYTGQEDIIIGSPIANRKQSELHHMVGFLVNTLIYRNRLNPDESFMELLAAIKDEALACYEYQDYPFDLLVEQLELDRDLSRSPLFNVMLAHNNAGTEDTGLSLEGAAISRYVHTDEFNLSKFDLIFFMDEEGEEVRISIEYNSDLFNRSTLRRMADNFLALVDSVIARPEIPVSQLKILSEAEYETVVRQFNDTGCGFTQPSLTLRELFEQQVEMAGDRIAVVGVGDGAAQLTYSELNKNVNRLAHYLREDYMVKPNHVIGVSVDRSLEMIVVLLGIIKSGAAYLALDPGYPRDRVLHVLEDSKVDLLIIDEMRPQLFDNYKGNIINFRSHFHSHGDKIKLKSALNPGVVSSPSDILYVNYTSGSTGTPNGAMLSHDILTNLIRWQNEKTSIDGSLHCLQFTSINFCVSFQEIIGTLTCGGKLHLIGDIQRQDIDFLMDFLGRHCIELLYLPFSYLNFLFNQSTRWDRLFVHCLTHIITAGEQLKITAGLKRFLDMNPGLQLHNHYGSTEMHVVTSYTLDASTAGDTPVPPAGKPIANVRIFILDNHLQPVPVGVWGELFVLGSSEIPGYIGNPLLTVEKLVKHPGLPVGNKRLYRSGDIGRWLEDGNIEIGGRKDSLVKVRGFRVEPGEIESKILAIEAVKQCVVEVKEDKAGQKYLAAFVTADNLGAAEIRRIIADDLPRYMIPRLVLLDRLPLMPNGKVDRSKLPEPGLARVREYVAPRSQVEKALVGIWAEVLGTRADDIGIHDDFFESGGHSLKAIGLTGKIHKEFKIEVSLSEVFKAPTVREISALIDSRGESIFSSVEPVEKKEYYALSSAQKRLFILQQVEKDNIAYNMPVVMVLTGKPRESEFEESFLKLIHRHESLRTSFEMVNETPVQRIHDNVNFKIERVKPSLIQTGTSPAGATKQEHSCRDIAGRFVRPFELIDAPLLRVGLMPLEESEYILMIDMHHIISDGISIGIFSREFMGLYGGEVLPGLKLQYRDYSQWQQGSGQQESVKNQEDYWTGLFSDELPVLNLPIDFQRPLIQVFTGGRVNFSLNAEEALSVKTAAAGAEATLFMFVLSLFNVLLSKLSGQEDIIIGTPTASRRHADLDHIIGMFVNTLCLRNYPFGEKTFLEFLKEVKTNALEAFENQEYPFEELVDNISVTRDTGRNPIFDVMFSMPNMEIPELEIPGLKLKRHDSETGISKFDLTLFCAENKKGEGLSFFWEYCTKLFKEETVSGFSRYFKLILCQVIDNPAQKLSAIEIITAEEKLQVLFDINDTAAEYPEEKTIHELFAEQVEKIPDRIALTGMANSIPGNGNSRHFITYRELNCQSCRLEQLLRAQGIISDSIVGIMAERSVEMIAAVLGILKAGGAYLPIDPDYPAERIKFMLADSNSRVLLAAPGTTVKARSVAEGESFEIIDISELLFFSTLTSSLTGQASPTDLAYVIYTSGSTGVPKGVTVEHRSALNILTAMQRQYPVQERDVYLLKTTYIFDVSITELFGWFPGFGRLAVLEQGSEKDPGKILEAIERDCITHINFVPAMFNIFVDFLSPQNISQLTRLKYIFLAGEALWPGLVERFNRLVTPGRIAVENLYGPTEAAVYSSYYSLSHREGPGNIPIGRPIPNVRLYILDKNSRLQPCGIPGELYISGVGLSRGYLNKPGLTMEKFFPVSPMSYTSSRSCIPGKIYRTGDLARWLPDGNIEFLGRIDFQVKIRGFRIELGEIENRLSRHDSIKETVVIARADREWDKYLCAYIVPVQGVTVIPDSMALREYLSRELPFYMVPSHFVHLQEIPLTPGGKVDRKALPGPVPETGAVYTAPRGTIEKKLAGIWSEVLFVPGPIGIDDNFFQLGGHSLRATIMVLKIQKELGIKIPLAEIFKTPHIRGIHDYLKQGRQGIYSSIAAVEKRDYYRLSSAQKRLFFLDRFEEIGTGYNMPAAFTVEGKLDKYRYEKVFNTLIARHESLRTSFQMIDNQPVQRVHHEVSFSIGNYDLTGDNDIDNKKDREVKEENYRLQDIIHHAFVCPFDLSRAPLLRVGIGKCSGNRHLVLFDMHHIISDGTSAGILMDEFVRLYDEEVLPTLNIQYKDFSAWQNNLYAAGKIKYQEDYWLNLYRDLPGIPRLNLPIDFPRPSLFDFNGDTFRFQLEGEDAIRFMALASGRGTTLFMKVLAAFYVLLYRYCGQEDMVIGSGIMGRPHADLQGIIGMFVNSLALRNRPLPQKTFLEFLDEVKTTSIEAFENQEVQFEELVDKINPRRDTSRNPIFDVALIFQNFEEPKKRMKDVVFSPFELGNKTSKFDLTLFVHPAGERDVIDFQVEYCTALFKAETIRCLAAHFTNILREAAQNPGVKIGETEMLSAAEKQLLIHDFNQTAVDYPGKKTIHELFTEQVKQSPDRIALVGQMQISYRVLNEKSNQAANYLCDKQRVRPDDRVGLLMDRNINSIIAILGILKAGAAYVPLEPSLPQERLKHMIDDAGIEVVISQRQYIRLLNRLQWECPGFHTFLCLDSWDIRGESEAQTGGLMDKKLWEYVAETAVDEITGGGWLSSYTGEPFSKEEMEEYGNNILEKLSRFLHKKMRVMEIGCASGITMYRLAPRVGFYYGIDLSARIIEQEKKRVKEENYRNIALACLPAHEIDQIEEKNFDLVIFNSVVQFFHGHNYLRGVIEKCISLLADKGYLFIGDIMDHDLKEALVKEMVDFKQADRKNHTRTKTDWSAELFVSRSFFEDLVAEIPGMSSVDFSEKIYTLENELTKFRYDALIKIEKNETVKDKTRTKRKHQDDLSVLQALGTARTEPDVESQHIAYVIYTSGTTGKPKGVIMEHAPAVNILNAMQKEYPILEPDVYLLKTPYVFDVSVIELFGWFLGGGRLVLLEKGGEKDPGKIFQVMKRECITHINFVPSMFHVFVDFITPKHISQLSRLKYIFLAGEALWPQLIERFNYLAGDSRITVENLYGPTEAAVYSSNYSLSGWEAHGNILIGLPLPNVKLYILDKNDNLQPLGVPGELFIGGKGLSRGYLNNQELTAEKFLYVSPLSYMSYIPGKIYKTGDLARRLKDGNIEFLGRIDFQVKIRGFRIELGEIENQLSRHQGIKEAVVIAAGEEEWDKYLCAYIVPVEGMENLPDSMELREYLSGKLPSYMVPAYFVTLREIPVTASGKIDRKMLPEPLLTTSPGKESGCSPPRDLVEEKLARIWSEVLSLSTSLSTSLPVSIGIDDNFFDLGGHSLRATILVSKIHKEFGIRIPLTQIFKTPSLRGIHDYIKQSRQGDFFSIAAVEKQEYYQLSSAQKRLFFLDRFEEIGTSYNMPTVFKVEGEVNKERFETVFKTLISRHETLRTSVHLVDDQPVQRVHDKAEVEFEIEYSEYFEYSEYSENFIRPFDLVRAPLLRVGIIRLPESENRFLLLVDMHHIISDGTSAMILVEEFARLYDDMEFPCLKLQYKDFASWQNRLFESTAIKGQVDYWLKVFPPDREIPRLHIPVDFPRPEFYSYKGDSLQFKLGEQELRAFYAVGSGVNATLFMNLLAAFYVVLYKYTGQTDMIVGSAVAGRPHTDLQGIVGMFVNILALRGFPKPSQSYRQFLKEVRQNSLEAFENQDVQFEMLVEKLTLERDVSRSPLFNVTFGLLNYEKSKHEFKEISISPHEYENKTTKFDLSVQARETEDGVHFNLIYYRELFKKETIRRMSRHYLNTILQVTRNPGILLAEIDILTPKEKELLIDGFNNTDADYPAQKTVHRLFADQAGKSPDSISAVFRDVSLTYRQLEEKANVVGNYLQQAAQVQPDDRVGILMGRSLELIVSMLGILKSGAAYVPLDPIYPEERIKCILKDAAIGVVISGKKYIRLLRQLQGECSAFHTFLCMDSGGSHGEKPDKRGHLGALNAYGAESVYAGTTMENLAYVIYTSGSTGIPKGVLIRHRGVVNIVSWFARQYGLAGNVHVLLMSNFTFDASVNQIFATLLHGAVLYVIDEETSKDILLLRSCIARYRINILNFVPALLKELLCNCEKIESVTAVISGALRLDDVTKEKIRQSGYDLYNQYGPTETTIDALTEKCSQQNVTLGTPVSNAQCYIFCRNKTITPVGVVGELHVGGAGMARGYLNNPELTHDRFIGNPYKPGTPVYRTGDLARWLPEGKIEFFGRADNQVKIRGYRIEPGEIETHLLNHNDIQEALVLAREDETGEKFLSAYLVSKKELTAHELHEYLSRKLPGYMIPSFFKQVEKIPLTPNGKVNMKALPVIGVKIDMGDEYAAPRNAMEKRLVQIWSEVLNVEKNLIGINGNFFRLGGHSLKAAILTARIHREMGFRIRLKDLFQEPTIRGLSRFLRRAGKEQYEAISPVEKKDFYELSYNQKRLWIIWQLDPAGASYHMVGKIRLHHHVKSDHVKQALQGMMARHESLRTGFKEVDDQPVQFIEVGENLEIPLQMEDISSLDENRKQERKQRLYHETAKTPFNLYRAPLFRVLLIKLAGESVEVVFNMHHIISDGWSLTLLKHEFLLFYNGYRTGNPVELVPLTLQYKDFSEWSRLRLSDPQLRQESHCFWREKLEQGIPALELRRDFNRVGDSDNRIGAGYSLMINRETKDRLKRMAGHQHTSLFTVMFSAYILLLSRFSLRPREEIASSIITSGREHLSLHKIVGFFVNSVILKVKVDHRECFEHFLGRVHREVLEIFEHQTYPLELVCDDLDTRYPDVPVSFNMLNLRDETHVMNMESFTPSHSSDVNDVKFDLEFYLKEYKNGIEMFCAYRKSMFRPETVEFMMREYVKLLEFFALHPDRAYNDYRQEKTKEVIWEN